MPSETDLETLYALQHCSTPERWAAFMSLAAYLVEHPEQRLGQAVVNKLMPSPPPDTDFVIMFDDNTYNQDGHQVSLREATRYPTIEAAQDAAATLWGIESILPAVDLAQPDLFYMTDAAAADAIAAKGTNDSA